VVSREGRTMPHDGWNDMHRLSLIVFRNSCAVAKGYPRFRGRLPPRMDCNDGCWRSGHVITQADDVVVVGLVVELEVVAVALQAELDVASVDLRPMKRL
jgi:hypothetical protein